MAPETLQLNCFFNSNIFQIKIPGDTKHYIVTTPSLLYHHTKYSNTKPLKKLDDGWPESVEEQGLLLLVWRHHITNNILKMCYRQSRRGLSRQNSKVQDNSLHRKHFYTQKFLHTEAFTHKSFHTQKLLQTDTFTHRPFYAQTLVTRKSFYSTDSFLHTDAFTQTLLHTKLLPTEAFTYRRFYTHTLLHRCFYTQTLSHTDTFTHRHF